MEMLRREVTRFAARIVLEVITVLRRHDGWNENNDWGCDDDC